MQHTPWTSRNSSLPSDRIAPKTQPIQLAKGKAKQKQKDTGLPKSKDVLKLERLRDDLRNTSGKEKNKKGGCFCQARMHALSTYNPICRSCGLILCQLNLPNHACPHCRDALLTPTARAALIETLESRIADTLGTEEQTRQRAIEEARAAEGAFPTLSAAVSRASTPGSGSDSHAAVHPVNQTHKVMSLQSSKKGKGKVKLASYPPPAVSRAASPADKDKDRASEPDYTRVPAPPSEVPCDPAALDPQRPWRNVRGLDVTYVPPHRE